jgi:hypothetical protein
MASIDVRTRRKRDIRALSVEEVRTSVLPDLLERHGRVAGEGVASIGAAPLGLAVGDGGFTLLRQGGVLGVRDGTGDATVVVALGEDALSDVLQDVSSLGWVLMTGRGTVSSGPAGASAPWDPVLRSLRDGVPVTAPGDVECRERGGSPLDLHRSFRLDDDPTDMGHFLAEAGYLHLRDVFTTDEMGAVSADLDAAMAAAARDDGQSWWARTDEGWYPARILGFNHSSPALRELLTSARFSTIATIVEDDLVQQDVATADMAEGLLKKIGVREGISDVSWHKDCGPGNHSYGCAGLTVGLQLTDADRHSGELGVMAGSNRANIPGLIADRDFGLPRVALSTSIGDCTIHCSCTAHMSRPPESAERRVCYTGFALAPLPDDVVPSRSAEEIRKDRAGLQDMVGARPGDRRQLEQLPLD